MKKQYIVLISSVSLAVLFVLGSYLYKQQQIKTFGFMAKSNASTFVREYSQTLGNDRQGSIWSNLQILPAKPAPAFTRSSRD